MTKLGGAQDGEQREHGEGGLEGAWGLRGKDVKHDGENSSATSRSNRVTERVCLMIRVEKSIRT